MAENPSRVKACFYTKEVNKAGIYLMSFYINGKETPVYVDEFLPVNTNDQPCFTNSNGEELWVVLLEKAWAKLVGSYASIHGGWTNFTAEHLLGVSTETINHKYRFDNEKYF
jgi:calpain-15